jgi:hypothetical protein
MTALVGLRDRQGIFELQLTTFSLLVSAALSAEVEKSL